VATASTINFSFKQKGGEPLYFCHLGLNKDRELFFSILWDKSLRPTTFNDGLDGSERSISNIDHFSFHKDGNVHMRIYNESGRKEYKHYIQLNEPIDKLPKNQFACLFILSIYDSNLFKGLIGKDSELLFKDHSNVSFEVSAGDRKNFSIAFFLVGSEVNHKTLTQRHYPGIFSEEEGRQKFIYNIFGDEDAVTIVDDVLVEVRDLGILIAVSEKVIPKPSSEQIVSGKQLKTAKRIEIPFGLNLLSSDNKINSLV
jgi:hypothetical protein